MGRWEHQNADVLSALRELQQHQAFSDLTIQLKQGPVRVNRILLAAVSPVFREMVLQKRKDSFDRLDMSHLSHEAWECITQFYFNNKACLSLEIVAEVLEVSEWYRMDGLKNYCCEFLMLCCTFQNCLQVMKVAKQFDLEGPAKKAKQVFSSHFQAGCSLEDFLCLEKSELLELLEKGELVTTEDDVCKALLAWMEAKDADADTCTELFQCVKLHLLSDDCLGKRVVYHSVSARTPAIQAKVQQELVERMKPSSRGLVVVGGFYNIQLFLWSEDMKEWIVPNVKIHHGKYFAATLLDDRIMITGGRGSNETHFFHLKNFALATGPELQQTDVFYHEMAVIGDKAYIVSGECDCPLTEAVHEYSEASRRWTKIGELRFATVKFGVTTLGQVIVVAGGNCNNTERLIQTFNVETRTAAVLDDRLPRPMPYCRAARLGNTAFFVGSQGDLVQVREVEGKFQITSHTLLQGFGEGSESFGLYVTDDCLHVVGRTVPATVECWDFRGRRRQSSRHAYPPLPLSEDERSEFQVKLAVEVHCRQRVLPDGK